MIQGVVLRLLHCVLSLSTFVRQWLLRFTSLSFKKTAISSIQSDARTLKKLPLHLGMIYLEDDVSYIDIANSIIWAIAMGISYISIYDTNGTLKSNKNELYDAIKKSRSYDRDSEKTQLDICLHAGFEISDTNKTSSKVHVFVLSLEDGRQSLVNTAKTICRRINQKVLKSADITTQTVEKFIQGETGYPDLDLVVKFGQVESLLGFMPWQIRLTEILSVPTHIGLEYKTFKSILHSYGDTQQRFGK